MSQKGSNKLSKQGLLDDDKIGNLVFYKDRVLGSRELASSN